MFAIVLQSSVKFLMKWKGMHHPPFLQEQVEARLAGDPRQLQRWQFRDRRQEKHWRYLALAVYLMT